MHRRSKSDTFEVFKARLLLNNDKQDRIPGRLQQLAT